MNVLAEVYIVVESSDEKVEETLKEKNMTIKSSIAAGLVGDGNALITRGRTMKIGLPYGVASISASCNVTLTCNQDEKTIAKAAKLCSKIRDKLMDEEQPGMVEFIEAMK